MRKRSLLLLCGLLALDAAAQPHFSAGAAVDGVARTGFYRLAVRPDLGALSRADRGDIRLLDEAGEQVPFLIQSPPRDSLLLNPVPLFRQTDSSDGNSYLTISQHAAYPVRSLVVVVESPHFFLRRISVFSGGIAGIPLCESELRSGRQPIRLLLPEEVKETQFRLVIRNGDNAPLRFRSIRTEQPLRYLVSWLEAGRRYRIAAGNTGLAPPDYDLVYFRDSIPAGAPALGFGAFVPEDNGRLPTAAAQRQAAIVQRRPGPDWWIWAVIVGSVLLLGGLAWRLLADLRRKGL